MYDKFETYKSIENQVFDKIERAKSGKLFFVDSFTDIGNTKAANKALERLVKSGKISRVAKGIYVRPVEDPYLGKVMPGIEEVATAIAKRDKARIVPTGSYAMYKLGLTSQVPLNVVYYTDSSARKIQIGKQVITFKKASSRNLAAIGKISKLVIQALRTIGENNATDEEIKQIRTLLQKEKPNHLQHDLLLAPFWIRKLLTTTNKTNMTYE